MFNGPHSADPQDVAVWARLSMAGGATLVMNSDGLDNNEKKTRIRYTGQTDGVDTGSHITGRILTGK